MVTYRQLKDARPQSFERAGGAWSKWADVVDDHAKDIRRDIVDYTFGGDVWVDKAADAGRDYVEGLTRGMGISFDGLEAVGATLKTCGQDVAAAQLEASRHVERAEAAGLVVDQQTGLASVPPIEYGKNKAIKTDDQAKQVKADLEAVAADCNAGVRGALQQATDADLKAARVLGEHSKPIPTLRELNRRSDRMQQLAHDAAALAKQGADLDAEELARLRDLLSSYSDDPAFASTVLAQLGTEGALRFGGQLSGLATASGMDPEVLGQLQAELGDALATATDKANGQHLSDAWVDKLMRAGEQKIDLGLPGGFQPCGHQVLGVLLHHGDYSEEFLNTAGDAMLGFERDHGGAGCGRPTRLTACSGPSVR